MEIINTDIQDVFVLKPIVHTDSRGFFLETFRQDDFTSNGIDCTFIQDNHSGSVANVLRGLHYQIRQPQGKLVRAGRGRIFDVAVDLRKSSPTFGKWFGIELSEENRLELWIPEGFAHGFYTLSNNAELIYKATNFYAPQWERTILWNDPDIGIQWPLIEKKAPILSEKDEMGISLKNAQIFN